MSLYVGVVRYYSVEKVKQIILQTQGRLHKPEKQDNIHYQITWFHPNHDGVFDGFIMHFKRKFISLTKYTAGEGYTELI